MILLERPLSWGRNRLKPNFKKKAICVIVVYMYVFHLWGLNCSDGVTAVTYWIPKIFFASWFDSMFGRLFFFKILGLYKNLFFPFMKKLCNEPKANTVTIPKHAMFENKNHSLCVTKDRCYIKNHAKEKLVS